MVFNLLTPFSGNLVRLRREMERMEMHPQLEVHATRVHWRVVLLAFGQNELSGSWTRSQFTKVGLASQLCDVCSSALQCRLEATRLEQCFIRTSDILGLPSSTYKRPELNCEACDGRDP